MLIGVWLLVLGDQVLVIVRLDVTLQVVQFNLLTSHVNPDEHPVHVANIDWDVHNLQPIPTVLYGCTYPPAPLLHIIMAVVTSRWSKLSEKVS